LYPAVDPADKESCRPDFAVALYPEHLWMEDEKKFELNPDIASHITRQTPTTFLLQAENDDVDNVNQSLVYYIALKNAGVPVEMHLICIYLLDICYKYSCFYLFCSGQYFQEKKIVLLNHLYIEKTHHVLSP
jgi:hypothetical protein